MLIHTVKKGDTLWQIAKYHHVSLEALISANPQIMDPNKIMPGMQVYVPQGKPIKMPTQPLNPLQENNNEQTSEHYLNWQTAPEETTQKPSEPSKTNNNLFVCPYCGKTMPLPWPNPKSWNIK